jgi:hypothetical protein
LTIHFLEIDVKESIFFKKSTKGNRKGRNIEDLTPKFRVKDRDE